MQDKFPLSYQNLFTGLFLTVLTKQPYMYRNVNVLFFFFSVVLCNK